MGLHVIEGTWDEIKRHEAELTGHWLRVTIEPTPVRTGSAKKRSGIVEHAPATGKYSTSVLGKYSFVSGGTEEFSRDKQAEIDVEDRDR